MRAITKERLRFFRSVKREALRAARAWDLCPQTVAAIKEAVVSVCAECVRAAIPYGDDVVRAQVLGVFMYATTLLRGRCNHDCARDIVPEKWEKGMTPLMVLEISNIRDAAEGGAE
ncbi:MAG: hypothetical protein IJQ73_12845 [Kiritimatiellae bacterium]|nr:hypothetical protein [Kiritimatiellia bacterium]